MIVEVEQEVVDGFRDLIIKLWKEAIASPAYDKTKWMALVVLLKRICGVDVVTIEDVKKIVNS
jgi:hypothetical protein